MKKACLLIAVLAVCGCASQQNSEAKQACAITTKAAEQIMSARQRGADFDEGTRIAMAYIRLAPPYRDIFQALLIDSWRQPIARTADQKVREVADFAEFNDYQCHKRLFG